MFLTFLVFLTIIAVELFIFYLLVRRCEGETFSDKMKNFFISKTWLGICLFFLLMGCINKNPVTITIWIVNILLYVWRTPTISEDEDKK